jgi:hypothetical protein
MCAEISSADQRALLRPVAAALRGAGVTGGGGVLSALGAPFGCLTLEVGLLCRKRSDLGRPSFG